MSEKTSMPDSPKAAFRRIVIGFDHHVESRAVLDVAARVAAADELELAGIFVEDMDLYGLAGLPFSTEFLVGTRRSRCFDLACVEQELRAQVGVAERALRDAAARARRRFSFRTIRGRLVRTLLAEAVAGDIIMLRRADTPWLASGALARPVIAGPVCIPEQQPEADNSISKLAATIASQLDQKVVALSGTAPEEIEAAARHAGAGLIILPRKLLADPAWEQGIEGFVDRVHCAVLIASPPAHAAA